MNPTPREFFRKNHAEDMAKLAIVINEPWFQRAIVAARAEISTRNGNPDFFRGADGMVNMLYYLADEDKPAESLPDHSQLKTYG